MIFQCLEGFEARRKNIATITLRNFTFVLKPTSALALTKKKNTHQEIQGSRVYTRSQRMQNHPLRRETELKTQNSRGGWKETWGH